MSYGSGLTRKIGFGETTTGGVEGTEAGTGSMDMSSGESKEIQDKRRQDAANEAMWKYCKEQLEACAHGLCGKEATYVNELARLKSWWDSKSDAEQAVINSKINYDLDYLVDKTKK